MGLSGIRSSTVSKLCKDIDERVSASSSARLPASGRISGSTRPTSSARGRPHRLGRRHSRRGSHHRGRREIVGLQSARPRRRSSGPTSCETWSSAACAGVKLVISDAHEGLKAAIRAGARRDLAEVPRPLDQERARLRAEGPADHGGGRLGDSSLISSAHAGPSWRA